MTLLRTWIKHWGKAMKWIFIICCTLGLSPQTLAEAKIEIIQLKSTSPEELIPTIKPLLREDEAVSTGQSQLIISAEPERINQIREIVEQLDIAPAQITITIRRADAMTIENDNRQSRSSRTYGTRKKTETRDQFSITTLDGNPAYIKTGQAIPLPASQSGLLAFDLVTPGISYQETTSGLYVLSKVTGNQVLLSLSSRKEAFLNDGSHEINKSELATTVQGELGRWISLGGTSAANETARSGRVYSTETRDEDKAGWWIKADLQ